MRSLFRIAAFALIAVGLATPARAGPLYFTFEFSGNGVVGTGTLITNDTPDPAAPLGGAFDVLSISGTVNGEAILGLVGTVGPAAYSPDGFFIYDNVFYPTGSESAAGAFLDIDGLLFNTAASSYNLFFDGSVYWYWKDQGSGIAVSFSAVDPPPPEISEPPSVLVLATGLVGVLLATRRRMRPRRAR